MPLFGGANGEKTMETIYFTDYYEAKEYAEKHNLIECEYGDTGYMYKDEPVSYVAYNKSGDRDGEWEVEAYYTWRAVEPNHMKPAPLDREYARIRFGI